MPTHQFTLIVEGPDLQDDALIDALYESGCDDALVGRSHGVQYLDFDRDAPSLEEAVLSAVMDVEQVAGVEVVRVPIAGLSVLNAGVGITADDLDFENMYKGFTTFPNYFIEGLGYAGIKRGEALDLYQDDISVTSAKPVSPSGGNQGSGRTRIWMHTDSSAPLQGRAGGRQVAGAEIGISGGPMPQGGDFTIWGTTP